MRNNVLLTTATLALSLAARPALAQSQSGDDQTRRPGAARKPEAGAPRQAEGGEAQPQRPAAGAAPSRQPAAGAAGRRSAEGEGAAQNGQRPGEAGQSPEQRRPAAGKPQAGRAEAGRSDGSRGAERPRIEGRLAVDERDAAGPRDRLVGTRRDAATDVRIDAVVGGRVPAEVTVREVSAEIVARYPAFRGYDYVVSEEQVVIVDPKTREIVEVIGGGGRRSAGAAPRPDLRQRITTEQRQVIHRQVAVEPANRVVFDERTVHEVPDTIVLRPLPDAVVEGVPDVRGYDYFVDSDHHVVLVGPDTREVVDILD